MTYSSMQEGARRRYWREVCADINRCDSSQRAAKGVLTRTRKKARTKAGRIYQYAIRRPVLLHWGPIPLAPLWRKPQFRRILSRPMFRRLGSLQSGRPV